MESGLQNRNIESETAIARCLSRQPPRNDSLADDGTGRLSAQAGSFCKPSILKEYPPETSRSHVTNHVDLTAQLTVKKYNLARSQNLKSSPPPRPPSQDSRMGPHERRRGPGTVTSHPERGPAPAGSMHGIKSAARKGRPDDGCTPDRPGRGGSRQVSRPGNRSTTETCSCHGGRIVRGACALMSGLPGADRPAPPPRACPVLGPAPP